MWGGYSFVARSLLQRQQYPTSFYIGVCMSVITMKYDGWSVPWGSCFLLVELYTSFVSFCVLVCIYLVFSFLAFWLYIRTIPGDMNVFFCCRRVITVRCALLLSF